MIPRNMKLSSKGLSWSEALPDLQEPLGNRKHLILNPEKKYMDANICINFKRSINPDS
jgi:hypothetical protein